MLECRILYYIILYYIILYYIILYYIIYTGCLLHVHVSATLVAILREVSTKDILQKRQEPVKIVSCKMHGLKFLIKYKIG
jgi:hypothetical protein